MELYAHRGCTANGAGENTIEAFAQAIKMNIGIELDVRLTKDNIPVIIHDKSLMRVAGKNIDVSSLSRDELKKIRLNTGENIPTLSETLKFVNNSVPLMIELKTPKILPTSYKLEKETVKLLKNYKGRYIVQSFNCFTVKYCKSNLSDIKCGRLASDNYGSKICGDFVNYKLTHLNSEKVKNFRKRGLGVFGWCSIDSPSDNSIEFAEKLGLDGLVI